MATRLATLRRSRTFRKFVRNRSAVVALGFLVLLVLMAIFAPAIAPADPDAQDISSGLQGPSVDHWLGTDNFGRDVLSRLIVASRIVVLAVVQAVGVAVIIGIPLGLLAGNAGRAVDSVLSRVFDGLLCFPPIILALAIVGVLGPGLTQAMMAIGVVLAPAFFRVARGTTLSARHDLYIEAARANGCTSTRILWRHLLPNIGSPLLVQVSFAVGVAIIAESSLSFLGLGVQPPQASWGSMLANGFVYVGTANYLIYAPAAMIIVTVLACAVLGDGLRDALGESSS